MGDDLPAKKNTSLDSADPTDQLWRKVTLSVSTKKPKRPPTLEVPSLAKGSPSAVGGPPEGTPNEPPPTERSKDPLGDLGKALGTTGRGVGEWGATPDGPPGPGREPIVTGPRRAPMDDPPLMR